VGREGETHIDISHGDARHDYRYVDSYLHSGGVILRSSERLIDLEGRCLKIGAARWLRQDFSPNGAKSAFGSRYSFSLDWENVSTTTRSCKGINHTKAPSASDHHANIG
jgi:hypothetical protein